MSPDELNGTLKQAPPDALDIRVGDAVETLQDMAPESVDLIVTSPPYYRRIDYGVQGQYGLEDSVSEYLATQRAVAALLLKAIKPTGVLFWVVQDTFNGSGSPGNDYRGTEPLNVVRGPREKDRPYQSQLLIPELTRIEFATLGWIPRMVIIRDKQSGRNWSPRRPSYSHEYIFLFSKTVYHYWDAAAVLGPNGARLGSVWRIPPGEQPTVTLPSGRVVQGRASFPYETARRCVLLGSPVGGVVLDPYCGMGTTGLAALQNNRAFVGIDLNADFVEAAKTRISAEMESTQ